MGIAWDSIVDICNKNNVEKLLVFGSVARGQDRPTSDIDLIVKFVEKKSLLDIIRIERELSEALGRKVDLLTEGAISPHMVEHVLSEARVVFERAA